MSLETLSPTADALRSLGVGSVELREPLSRHTTFGIGGPAGLLVEPATREQVTATLSTLREVPVDVRYWGLGSNCLVSDRGFPGVVVKTLRGLRLAVREGSRLRVEAGVPLKKACSLARDAGLRGLEFAISIPGSVGGAVTMNAGAHGSEMAHVVERVTVWTGSAVEEIRAEDLQFGYRESQIQHHSWMVLDAVFRLEPDDTAAIAGRMRGFMDHRKRTQPLGERNAGSMFKNPGDRKAGALIEAVGAKGWREGAAEVSRLHANFINNTGSATALQVLTLMRRIREAVDREYGVVLRPEVRWVGPAEGEAGSSWDSLWLKEAGGCAGPSG